MALRSPSDEWIVNFFLRVFFYPAPGIRSCSSFKLLLLAVTVFTPIKTRVMIEFHIKISKLT